MAEDASLGGEQYDRTAGFRPEHAFNSGEDRFDFHHHPTAAAVWFIVGDVMLVCGPVADVVEVYVNQPALAGTIQNTTVQIRGKNFR